MRAGTGENPVSSILEPAERNRFVERRTGECPKRGRVHLLFISIT